MAENENHQHKKSLIDRIKENMTPQRTQLAIVSAVILVLVGTTIAMSLPPREKTADYSKKDEDISPTKKATSKKKPTPTEEDEEEQMARVSPTKEPTKALATATPTLTPTKSPTNTPQPTATLTPTPLPPDTTPPTITSMTGPENGTTVTFKSFCFPMTVSDDRSQSSKIQVQHKFDGNDWTAWGSEYAPCFTDVANGEHTFSVKVKDEAGNISTTTTRTFTVNAS